MSDTQPVRQPTSLPFGQTASAFGASGDDRSFFPSAQHVRALEFMGEILWTRAQLGVLVAQHGCGKSLLIHRFVRALDERFVVAAVSQEGLSPREFLQQVLQQFGLVLQDSDKTDRRRLVERFLHHQGAMNRLCLLIVENPQQMHPSVLEELRLLASIECEGQRVLKLLLLGQPPINRVIQSPRMTELLGGGMARFTLESFTEDQTAAYVAHRLRAAGVEDPDALMPYTLMPQIHAHTAGVPLRINQLCERALLCAAEDAADFVTPEALARAAAELGWPARTPRPRPVPRESLTSSASEAGKLILSMQGLADREVLLEHDRMLIGRGEEADVRIDSVFVSRYHALIVRHDGQDLLLDLGSTNGLLFNSRRILRRVLKDGDIVQVGPARLVYSNPFATQPAHPDPNETVCFARPGFPMAAGEDEAGSGTVIAFGQLDPHFSGGR